MRKKYLIAGVVLALSLSMVGCGKDTGSTTAEGTTGDVTTEAEVASEEQTVSLLPMDSVDETVFTLNFDDISLGIKKIKGMNLGGSMNQWNSGELVSSGAFMYNGATLDESTIVYEYHLSNISGGGDEYKANDDGIGISYYANLYSASGDSWGWYGPLEEASIEYAENSNITAAKLYYEKELGGEKSLRVEVYVRNMDVLPWEEALSLTDDIYYNEGGEKSTDTIGHSETEGKYVYSYNNEVYGNDGVGDILGQDMEIIAKRLNNSIVNDLGGYQLDNYEVYYDIKKLTKDEFEKCSDIDEALDFEVQTITNGDGDEIVCRKVKTAYSQYVDFYKQLENENVAILVRVYEVDMNEVNPKDFIDLTKDCYFDFSYPEMYVTDNFN